MSVEALRAFKATQAAERLALGLGKEAGDLVFTDETGEPVNPRAFSKEFARLVGKAGIPRISFHGLRHSHLTSLLKAGVHPKIASERARLGRDHHGRLSARLAGDAG